MYDLCLLDLDGLLVRTEELHFAAYRALCARRGLALDWDFTTYCLAAHYGQQALRQALEQAVPGLFAGGLDWPDLHREKSRIYLESLAESGAQLQPGASELFAALRRTRTAGAVVTNSSREQVRLLTERLPELAAVGHWVTREDYDRAKPHPDAYQCALRHLGVSAQRAVGLEDTPRGVAALRAAGVTAFLVSRIPYPADAALDPSRCYPDLPSLLAELFPAASGMA